MAADGSIVIDTRILTDGINKGIGDIGNKVKSGFTKLGKSIAAAVSVGIIARLGKEALELGSDLAEVQNVVDTVFPTMNEEVNKFAQNASSAFGLSETMAKRYAGAFGAMADSFGFAESESYKMSAALTGLSGDVASFYNITQDEAYTKLKSVFTGETESLKELGVVMTQSALDSFALAKGYKKTTKEMSEQEKVALRYAFVMDRLSNASGDFSKTSDSWANQTRLLKLNFESFMATVGQGLINLLTPIIKALNKLFELLQDAAERFKAWTELLTGNKISVSSEIKDADKGSGNIADSMEDAAVSTKKIKNNLSGLDEIALWDSGKNASENIGSGVENLPKYNYNANIITNKDDVGLLSKLFDDIKKKLIEISKFTGLDGLWEDFNLSLRDIKNGLSNIWNLFSQGVSNNSIKITNFKNHVASTFQNVSQTTNQIFGDMLTKTAENFNKFTEENGPAIEEFFTNLTANIVDFGDISATVIDDVFTSIGDWWDKDGIRIYDEISNVIADIQKWGIETYNEYIQPVIDKIKEKLSWLWDEHLKPLWDDLLEFFTSLWDCIYTLYDLYLRDFIDFLIHNFWDNISWVFDDIIDIIFDVAAFISDKISLITKVFTDILDFITDIFKGDWDEAWQDVKKMFRDAWDGVCKLGADAINIIIDGLNMLWDGLYTAVRKVVNGIGKTVEKLGDIIGKDWGFSIPDKAPKINRIDIPKLASGAVIPPNAPFAAVLGDQKRGTNVEAPLETIKQALREVLGNQSGGGTYEFIAQLNGKTIFRQIIQEAKIQQMQTGMNPFMLK